MEVVRATRDELLRTKEEIRIAEEGKEILERKKEALLQRFLAIVREYRGKREALLGDLKRGQDSLSLTKARDGSITVKSIALATKREIELDISRDDVMGTRIFSIAPQELKRDMLSRGYNPANTSSRIEKVATQFEALLENALAIAHLEHNIKVVGREMRSLNRKINALEETIIPNLKAKRQFIEDALAQNEREEIFRLKLIKGVLSED